MAVLDPPFHFVQLYAAYILFPFHIHHLENALAGGDTFLHYAYRLGKPFNGALHHRHSGDEGNQTAGGDGLAHGIQGHRIENRRKATHIDQLDHRPAHGVGEDQLHLLLLVVFVLFAKLDGFISLAVEHLDDALGFDDFLGHMAHAAHGILDARTDFAEALGDFAHTDGQNRRDDQEDHRQLDVFVQHQRGQPDHAQAVLDYIDCALGHGLCHLFGVVQQFGKQFAGGGTVIIPARQV